MDDKSYKASRRKFLGLAGAGAAAVLLAACGDSTATTVSSATTASGTTTTTAAGAAATTAAGAATTAAGAATTAAAVSGPPKDISATVKIFNWGDASAKKIFDAAIVRFNQKYPNVKVEDTFVPSDDWAVFSNKLTTQIAGGQSPDIVRMAVEGAKLVSSKGLVEPLEPYLSRPDSQDLVGDVAQPLVDALKGVDGKAYYLPLEWNNMVIYYNTKMFKDAGVEVPKPDWTWDDFLATAKKMTTGSGANQVFGFGIPYFNFGIQPFFLTNGTSPLTADWSASNLDDPKMLESVQFIHDLVHVHKVSPSVQGTDTGNLFSSGKIAMTGFGHWPIGGFVSAKFTDFDVQNWPRKRAATTVFGSGGWGLVKAGKNKDIAWELIKELNSKETVQGFATGGSSIPARRSVAESPDFLKFPANSKIFYGSIDDAKCVPAPANFADVSTTFMRYMDQIMNNSLSPADGLKKAHEETVALMAQLKSGS